MEKNNFFAAVTVVAIILMSAVLFMSIENGNVALGQPINSEDSGSDIVTILGTVVYNKYDQGRIVVTWIKDGGSLEEGSKSLGGDPVILKEPGDFFIEVPKNTGNIYLTINYYDQTIDSSHIDGRTPKAASINYGPIEIGSDDVVLGDLQLEESKELLVEDYKGLTVKIAGKVIVDNYEKGLINIIVLLKEEKSFTLKPSYIASEKFAAPGDYTIKVPQGAGNVYIYALNIPTNDPNKARGNMPGRRIGAYAENPLNIESTDLNNVDIVIK